MKTLVFLLERLFGSWHAPLHENVRPMNWIKLLGPVGLYLLPILVLVGVGAWGLWESGRWVWLFWMFPLCWGVAWWWRRSLSRAAQVDVFHAASSPSWTPRDEQAWQIVVKGELERASGLTLAQL